MDFLFSQPLEIQLGVYLIVGIAAAGLALWCSDWLRRKFRDLRDALGKIESLEDANREMNKEVARLRGPIGLDLGGRQPAETALAILAEITAVRYGGTGGELTGRR